MSGNLKPAPLALTPALVGKLAGDRPAYGAGIAHLPLEGKVNEPAWCVGCGLPDDCCCPEGGPING